MRTVCISAAWVCLWTAFATHHCSAINEFQRQSVSPAHIREAPESVAEAKLGSIIIRARYYVLSGQNEKARETYLQAVAEFPRCAYAHFQLAGLLLGADEKDSRLEHLEKAIELDPTMKAAYERLALCYLDRMETEKVIATYTEAIRNVEDNLSFYSRLADAYLSLDKKKEAEDALLEACNRHAASPQSWLKLIEFYVSRRESQKADEAFEKGLKATRNSLKLLRDVRALYLRPLSPWKEKDKALGILVRTLELYPDFSQMWLGLIRHYLSAGEKEKAVGATQKAIERLHSDENFFTALVVAYVAARDLDSAIMVLTEATKYHPDSVPFWRTLANLYDQKGEREKSKECYRKILSIEPTRMRERSLLALSYLASGQFEEGEKVYLDLIKARPEEPRVYLLLADYYLKSNKLDKMREATDTAARLEEDPAGQARVFSLMGQSVLGQGNVPIALHLLREAVNRQPNNASHLYALARGLLVAGAREEAAEHLQEALELAKSPDPDWLLILAETYRTLGKKDQADKSFAKAIALLLQNCERRPGDLVKRYQLGQAYQRADEMQLAAEAYAECVRLQPENGNLRYKLATMYSQLHFHEKAQEQLEEAIKLLSPRPEWFLQLGEVYRTLAKRSQAALAFDRAIAILGEQQRKTPQDSRVWAALGEAHSTARQYAKAVKALRKAIELAGEKADFRLHVALARALESSGKSQAAREEYLKAAALMEKEAEENPKDADNYLRLGLIYQSLRDFTRCAEAFSRGIELAGGDSSYSSYVALADSLEKAGKLEAAQAQFQKAYSLLSERIKEHPKDVSAHYLLANVSEKLGNLDQCEREYRTVMELDPFFAAAYNNLGYTWIERNLNLEEAMKLVRKALELEPESGAYIDSLGWGYFKQGKLDEALSELQRALKFENTDPTIYDHIGDVYEAKNMMKEAIRYWQKALQMNPSDKKIKDKIEKNRSAFPPPEKKDQPEDSG